MQIEARNITVSYGAGEVLHDVSFSCGQESLVLLGPNGSGKTTLFKVLAGFLSPLSGTVLIGGGPLQRIPRRDLARMLAILPQDSPVPAGMSVQELVTMGRFPYRKMFAPLGKRDKAVISEVMEQLHLTDLRDRPISSLSGGECRRAKIAMTLAQEPEILLLDEPAAYLDIAAQIEVADLIRTLRREGNLTVITILHELELAARCADRIAMMRSGRIMHEGPAAQMLTPEVIRVVFGVETMIARAPDGSAHCIVSDVKKVT